MNMNFSYKFSLDKRSRRVTGVVLLLVVVVSCVLGYYFHSAGDYVVAWFVTLMMLILALALLSAPRRLVVVDSCFEIRCGLKIVAIDKSEIVSVRRLPRAAVRYIIPVWANHGFGGYSGWYYNLASRKMIKVYGSRWENMVQIQTAGGTKYVVSCDNTQGLIKALLVTSS